MKTASWIALRGKCHIYFQKDNIQLFFNFHKNKHLEGFSFSLPQILKMSRNTFPQSYRMLQVFVVGDDIGGVVMSQLGDWQEWLMGDWSFDGQS